MKIKDKLRWHNISEAHTKNEKIDLFLLDIIDVCKKHQLTISHEDGHGSFIIEDYNEFNIKWLNESRIDSINIYNDKESVNNE